MNQAKIFFILSLLVLVCSLRVLADEHPVAIPKDADSAKCLECHEEKGKGKAVHSAIQMGCTSCHEIKTQGETTNINLTAPKEQLCFTCHDKSKDDVRHAPYDKGECVTCHDPHTSDFPKQTRAEGNALCLECHAERAQKGDKIELFKSQSISAQDFEAIPKILPNSAAVAGHPWANHPVGGVPDPLHPGQKMSCQSCHETHSSTLEKLVVKQKDGGDLCDTCHNVFETERHAALEKKYGAAAEQAQKAADDTQRRQHIERPQIPQSPTKTGANKP